MNHLWPKVPQNRLSRPLVRFPQAGYKRLDGLPEHRYASQRDIPESVLLALQNSQELANNYGFHVGYRCGNCEGNLVVLGERENIFFCSRDRVMWVRQKI